VELVGGFGDELVEALVLLFGGVLGCAFGRKRTVTGSSSQSTILIDCESQVFGDYNDGE